MDVFKRYLEQLETTVETMRRRCIAVYDGTIRFGSRSARLVESLRELAEPVVYDAKEAVTTAVQDMSPLDPNEMEVRNNLLELYLGCSVLSIGLSAGEISGAFVLGALYDRIFDWWWEVILAFLLPIYTYLTFRKNAALDEMERRVSLFWIAMCCGSLLAHVIGGRIVSTMPAVFFVLPLIVGLAVDNELSPPAIYSDRTHLLGLASGAGLTLATMLLFIGGLTLCSLTSVILQSVFLAAHFQVAYYCMKNKTYGAGEAQLSYILISLLLNIIVSVLLGHNPAESVNTQ